LGEGKDRFQSEPFYSILRRPSSAPALFIHPVRPVPGCNRGMANKDSKADILNSDCHKEGNKLAGNLFTASLAASREW